MKLSKQQRICLKHIGMNRWQLAISDVNQSTEAQYYLSDRPIHAAAVLCIFPDGDRQHLPLMQCFIADLLLYLQQSEQCIVFSSQSASSEMAYTFQQLFTVVQPQYIIDFASGSLLLEQKIGSICCIETVPLEALLADPLKKQQVLEDVQSSAFPKIGS